jgi:hypothetical protein
LVVAQRKFSKTSKAKLAKPLFVAAFFFYFVVLTEREESMRRQQALSFLCVNARLESHKEKELKQKNPHLQLTTCNNRELSGCQFEVLRNLP